MTEATGLRAGKAIEILTRQQRRRKIAESRLAQGLDTVHARAIDERAGLFELALRFIPPSLPASGIGKQWRPERLTPSNIRIKGPGGGMVVESVHYPKDDQPVLVRARTRISEDDRPALLSPVYSLHFHDVSDLDPFFSRVDFTLTQPGIEAALAGSPASETDSTPLIDYLNKDYASFRRLMLDNMTLWDSTWRERSPADLGVVIIETLAYAADYLSYYQDAAATEAYLFTAWRRTSVRRHARLAGYRMHEGCSARVWVHIAVHSSLDLRKGTQFTTGKSNTVLPGEPAEPVGDDQGDLRIFEAITGRTLDPRQNGIPIYTWGASESTLRQNAFHATLAGTSLNLKAGDTIVFEMAELSANGDIADNAVPGPRHAVRLSADPLEGEDTLYGVPITRIEWLPEDAVPVDLPVRVPGGGPVQSTVARGNIVLADMGQSVGPFALPMVPERGLYRPELPHQGITFAEAYDPSAPAAATATLRQDPTRALPCVTLYKRVPGLGQVSTSWTPVADLLSSDGFDRHFVVEVETGGASFLRFGDGELGRRPSKLTRFEARYRVGDGSRGNIGADTLNSVYAAGISSASAVRSVRNPLPAQGGTAFENKDSARLAASSVSERRYRSITPDDYARIARRHPEVNSAFMERRSAGTSEIDVLFVQRRGGLPWDSEFAETIRTYIEPTRMLGRTIEVVPPRFTGARIELEIEVAPPAFGSPVQAALEDRFQSGIRASGERGFFYPDNFRFGQPLYLSAVLAAAMEIDNVRSVRAIRFEAGAPEWVDHLAEGVIRPEPNHIVRVPGNPREPEQGQIAFVLKGDR
jgi:hypothetical protein